jgi:hypothetical protein
MANLVSFNQALTNRCGITQQQARDAFAGDGYDGMEAFAMLTPGEIENFVKSVNKTPGVAGADPPHIPHASILRLKVMRLWTIWQQRQGIAVIHTDYTQAAENWARERYRFESDLEINKPGTPSSPDKFMNFDKSWRSFKDGVIGMLTAVRGGMNIPLAYVLRSHDAVDIHVRDAEYTTSDDFLMAVVEISADSTWYKADNARVWNLIHPLLHSTNAWEYIRQFERTKNARAAWKVLMAKGEGEAQLDTKLAKAKKAIETLKYNGMSKRFTLQTYFKEMVKAFNDLDECGKGYADVDKVLAVVNGIQVRDFNAIKTTILSQDKYKHNFDATTAFIAMMLNYNILDITDGSGSNDRNVSTVNSGEKDKWLPQEEWNKLSPAEKAKRNAARAKAKANKSSGSSVAAATTTPSQKRKAKKKRKLARLAKEVIDAAEAAESTNDNKKQKATGDSPSPADQFGRHASAVKLAKLIASQNANQSDSE